ncbi:hypothetical protein [Jiangella anatolica]|uniref:Uncharacterized protein n=1 Tax=Jiangella anatolica TaxID=2670374 RepID=A0A2W2CMA9_9ACTN|nr:hypothetical protein [Jiangella anatolica]PZF81333.1 hypothetical protein C1I92_21490 [Jiangella anatolica]
MPTVLAVEADVIAELTHAAAAGAALVGLAQDEKPDVIVRAIDELAHARLDAGAEADRGDALNLGVLLGEQYVRAFGWGWVQLEYPDGDTSFAVVDPQHTVGNQPMNWVYVALQGLQTVNFMLNFNMVAAGRLPAGTHGDPEMFH